jgi:uncharacterized RDD family membrane protein YckC
VEPDQTPQQPSAPVGLAPDVAGLGQRFLARLIAGLIILVPNLVALAVAQDRPVFGGLLALAIAIAYEVPQLAARGATVGKRAMGIRVVTVAERGNPSAAQAFVRVVVPELFIATPSAALQSISAPWTLAVYLAVFFDPWRRGLHDRFAGTRVVRDA